MFIFRNVNFSISKKKRVFSNSIANFYLYKTLHKLEYTSNIFGGNALINKY